MPRGRLALTVDGQMTYCTATPENVGRGRCNHVTHLMPGESVEEFMERAGRYEFHSFDETQRVNTVMANSVIGGSQEKFWEKDGSVLYKQDNVLPSKGSMQWNGLGEEIASQFLDLLDVPHAHCETCFVNGRVGCKSVNILKPGEQLIEMQEILTYQEMCELTDIENDDLDAKFERLCDILQERVGVDCRDELIRMTKIDLLLMSADRHYGNFGLVLDESGQYHFAPIYDNGSCLMNETTYRKVDVYWDRKLLFPGPVFLGMFPTEDYLDFVKRHSGPGNVVQVDMERMEQWVESYQNPYYDEDTVERVKWLLWDDVEFYEEEGAVERAVHEGQDDQL